MKKIILATAVVLLMAIAFTSNAQKKPCPQKEKEKPTLIITKSHIGFGSPNKVDTAEAHGSPLGKDELIATKKNLTGRLIKIFMFPKL